MLCIRARTRTLFSSYHRETSSRNRLWDRSATVIRSVPVRRHSDDNIGADAERIVKVKVTPRRVLHGDIAVGCAHAHTLHVRCRATWDCLLNGTCVEAFDGHGCACVQVSVVYCILRYHWRDYEELARARDFFWWRITDVVQ